MAESDKNFEQRINEIDTNIGVLENLLVHPGRKLEMDKLRVIKDDIMMVADISDPYSCVAAVSGYRHITENMSMVGRMIENLKVERKKLVRKIEEAQDGIPGRP